MSTQVLVLIGLFLTVLSIRLLRTHRALPTHEPRTHFTKWEMRLLLAFVIAFLLYAGKQRYEEHQDWNNRIAMPITAEPYVWPEGCEKKEYVDMSKISKKCESIKYYMGSDRKYYWRDRPSSQLSYSQRPDYYYRVGNDALEIRCSFLDLENCFVTNIVKNVFEVKGDG
jgi:hypothetical protein